MKINLVEQVDLSIVDTDSEEYSLEYPTRVEGERELEEEIKKFGFLYPPMLVQGKDKYHVVFGKIYIDVHKRLGKNLPCGLLLEDLPEKEDFLKYLIFLKRETKGFNIIEKSIALKKVFECTEKRDLEILKLLEIPKNENIIKNFLHLSEASDIIKILVLKGKLNEYTAFEIFKFQRGDWDCLANFISRIFLPAKKRNEVVSMLFDICQRDNKDIGVLIENEKIKGILSLKIDPPHIGERVYSYFYRLRNPYIYTYREKFYEKLKKVGIRKNFHFIVPRDFEEWKFKLILSFSSVEEFKKNVDLLSKIGAKKSFIELMEYRY